MIRASIACLPVLISCTGASLQESTTENNLSFLENVHDTTIQDSPQAAENIESSAGPTASDNAERAAAQPVQVAGSFLTCHQEPIDNNAMIGCVIKDDLGIKQTMSEGAISTIQISTMQDPQSFETIDKMRINWHKAAQPIHFSFLNQKDDSNAGLMVTVTLGSGMKLSAEVTTNDNLAMIANLVTAFEGHEAFSYDQNEGNFLPENPSFFGTVKIPENTFWESYKFASPDNPCTEHPAFLEIKKEINLDTNKVQNQFIDLTSSCRKENKKGELSNDQETRANLIITSNPIKLEKDSSYRISFRYSRIGSPRIETVAMTFKVEWQYERMQDRESRKEYKISYEKTDNSIDSFRYGDAPREWKYFATIIRSPEDSSSIKLIFTDLTVNDDFPSGMFIDDIAIVKL